MKKIIGALLVVLSHAFIPWRAPPPMPRMPQRLLSESNEEQLRDQLEETSTTLTTEQATRLAELEERGGGSQRDEEVIIMPEILGTLLPGGMLKAPSWRGAQLAPPGLFEG